MNFQRIPSSTKDKDLNDLTYANDYPTLSDLIKQQNVLENLVETVHRRRDLDSLGEFIKDHK